MSTYRGRTGPNVSAYLNNLNSVATPYDQEHFNLEDVNFNENLAIFTNAEFTNIDNMNNMSEDPTFNFDMSDRGDVKFEDLLGSSSTDPLQPNFVANLDLSPVDTTQFQPFYNAPIQPGPTNQYSSTEDSLNSANTPHASGKRKSEQMDAGPVSPDERSRVAAEEDKRRRNTAASARFRVKKKQREQALEQTVKEAGEKNAKLESKLHQLELENKWLKELITEKNGLQSKEEIAAAYQKFRKESEERELKGSSHKDGVGTK